MLIFKNLRHKMPEISDGRESGYFFKGSLDPALKHRDCASPPVQHKQNGMTLIEILIVVVMLAILVAVLTPSMNTYFNQGNIKGAAEALYGDVNLARTIATKSTNTVTITFNTGAWCYGLSSGTVACACSSAPSTSNCNLGLTTSSSFKNTTLAVTNTTMTFSTARGTTASNAAVFSATNPAQSATVTINNMGTPSICSTGANVGGYPTC